MEETLEYMRREIGYRLGVADDEVRLENATVLSDRSDTRGAVISLVNLKVSPYQGGGIGKPDLLDSLEVFLLFSFRFKEYKTSLQYLYRTVRLFNDKPAYTAADTHPDNPFPATLDKIFLTLIPLELNALNDLWGMFGGTYHPSVLYTLRMVRKQVPLI